MKEKFLLCKRIFLFISAFVLLCNIDTQAQSIDKLEQFANGALKDALMAPSMVATNVDWVTGNVNAAKAHYACGMTIPYRLQASGLETGVKYQVTIGYDITKGGKHAIDFLTSFNRDTNHDKFGHFIDGSIEDVETQILLGTALEGTGPLYNNYELPPPDSNMVTPETPEAPLDGFNASKLEGFDSIRIYNGTITDLYNIEGSPGGDTESSYLVVEFQVDPGQSIILLAWGGNIACEELWGPGSSAADINGSPYHMYVEACSGLGGCGNKEVQLSATAIVAPPAIGCEVSATPQSCCYLEDGTASAQGTEGTEYSYSWTGPDGFTAFTQTITGLAPGRYYVTVCDLNDNTNCSQCDTLVLAANPEAPVLVGVPTGGDLGCNPVELPECDPNVTATVCGVPVLAEDVTCVTVGPTGDGCEKQQVFTYEATACGLITREIVTYTWIEAEVPVISTTDVDTDLGCNPQSIPVPSFSVTDECNPSAV
ncbi:hypothetical protein OU798_18555, partial [Prolixibacteraceae bacterium Z1-6]|nr:hypothetical protein [Prolixibacteraceae bacterium Z1-6]